MRALRRGAGRGPGRCRRQLLRSGRALAARHPSGQPRPQRSGGGAADQGRVRSADGGRAGRASGDGRRPGPYGADPGGTPRAGSAVVRAAPPVVPAQAGGPLSDVQHPAGPAARGGGGRGSAARGAAGRGRAARVAAYGLPGARRRAVPAGAGPGGGGLRLGAAHGHGGRAARRPRRGGTLRLRAGHGRPGTRAALRNRHGRCRRAAGLCAAAPAASHRRGRLVHGPAGPRRGRRLYRPRPGRGPAVGRTARAVRRLLPVAA